MGTKEKLISGKSDGKKFSCVEKVKNFGIGFIEEEAFVRVGCRRNLIWVDTFLQRREKVPQ